MDNVQKHNICTDGWKCCLSQTNVVPKFYENHTLSFPNISENVRKVFVTNFLFVSDFEVSIPFIGASLGQFTKLLL
jgi:hypothetical protein